MSVKYDAQTHPQRILELRTKGYTIGMIAKQIGVHNNTIRCSWATKYAAVASALQQGREILTETLERNLYKQAQGYDYREIVTHYNAEGEVTGRTEYIKHQPGHVAAAIFALKNLRPDKWRDVHQIDQNVSFQIKMPPKEMWQIPVTEVVKKITDGNGDNQGRSK